MDIAEKVLRQKKDFDDVYEAGKKAEYDAFWDRVQDYGNRTNYDYAFAGIGWIEEIFKPKHDIVPLTANGMFQTNRMLNGDMDELIKKQGIIFDTSKCTSFTNFANSAVGITKFPPLDFTSVTTEMGNTNTFSYCSNLVEFEITINATTPFSNGTFNRCVALQKLIINGTIGQKNFNVQWSPLLSADSLKSIINALSTTTTGLTITLPKTAQANYEAVYGSGSWSTLTATRSNWSIAYA